MRVLLATLGSRGDVEPFLALALALQAAGHEPTLCASRRFQAWIAGWGVAYEPMDDGFVELLESLEGRAGLERAASPLGMLRTVVKLAPRVKSLQVQVQRDLWAAAQACRPQAMVFHAKLGGAPDIAEKLAIPAALLLLVPALQPTAEFACPVFPRWLRQAGGPRMRLAGYRLVQGISRRLAGPATAWRREQGWGHRPGQLDLLHDAQGRQWPVLHAHSPSLLPRPHDWPTHALVTGFLRLPAQPGWKPADGFQAFLDAGPPPVYIGFGSMAGRDPHRRAQQVVEGLRLAGLRGVLGRGWGGLLPQQSSSDVFVLNDAPHDWVFPRMAAVVHHGGAGTTAAGLLAGKPSLICPFFGDQPFWGDLVHQKGLGPAPIPQSRFDALALASALRRMVDDRGMQEASWEMARRIATEDGGVSAVGELTRLWTLQGVRA